MLSAKLLTHSLAALPPLRRVLEKLPLARRICFGWDRRHPFDARHGTETSGYVSADELARGGATRSRTGCYAGSQPSIVAATLALLPDPARYSFVDLGCGKGRALIVASELPYRRLLGIDISADLAAAAAANAAIVNGRHPQRTPIEVRVGDAADAAPPTERVVYFIYNAFPAAVMAGVIAGIEHALENGLQHAFLVYYNPVCSDLIDRSPRLCRWSAETLAYASDEIGFGPDVKDTVVVWQSNRDPYPARPGADRPVVVTKPGLYAEIADPPA